MEEKEENKGIMELGQRTLQSNREHSDALKTYIEELETELGTLDKLIDAVDNIDESDLVVGSSMTIPGSVRAMAPVTTKELLSPKFPFYKDVLKRSRYQSFSQVHPMKPKELEALAEAVQAENFRKHALDIQRRGYLAFPNIDTQTTRVPGLDVEGPDWNRVAEKVSAVFMTARTARECEIRWLGEQHPDFNREPWSTEEVLKVKSLAAEFVDGQLNWVAVAKRLGTRRTPLDCMRHATSRKAHRWTTEADERLLKAIRMYGHDNWHLVARYVSEDVTPSQCSSRFEKTLDETIKHTTWSSQEDARLCAAVTAYGSSWVDVASTIPGRHNDQCRERWTDQVNPSINKSTWSEEEDRLLLDYVQEQENVSWKAFSERLSNGRTEDMCRHRYGMLQKGAISSVSTVPAVNSGVQVASVDQAPESSDSVLSTSNTLIFEPSSCESLQSSSPALPHSGSHRPTQLIFLEPVVNTNPESHSFRRPRSSQRPARFKAVTVEPLDATTKPPSKRRKAQPRVSKSTKAANSPQTKT